MDSEAKTSDREDSLLSDLPTDPSNDGDGAYKRKQALGQNDSLSNEQNVAPINGAHGTASDSETSSSDLTTQSTEWLATARKRRSTAGNRMKTMLAAEEPDSDLELLFAEDEDDEGFSEGDADASDARMNSSSDDEDENGSDDDSEGERELERQNKERRLAQRKRKAQNAIPAKFRKRVRIDTSPASTSPPRPRKKSERASWLPSPADLPTRASSRQTTRLSKEQLHQQMEEREARRLKQLVQMQKKAAKLEAMKKPPMTQERRLAEAAIVEERNSRSLNRWEEAEKQREEQRKAKLAALNSRTLRGPFITFWSGIGESGETRGQLVSIVEEKPRKKREKAGKAAQAQECFPSVGLHPDHSTESYAARMKPDEKLSTSEDAVVKHHPGLSDLKPTNDSTKTSASMPATVSDAISNSNRGEKAHPSTIHEASAAKQPIPNRDVAEQSQIELPRGARVATPPPKFEAPKCEERGIGQPAASEPLVVQAGTSLSSVPAVPTPALPPRDTMQGPSVSVSSTSTGLNSTKKSYHPVSESTQKPSGKPDIEVNLQGSAENEPRLVPIDSLEQLEKDRHLQTSADQKQSSPDKVDDQEDLANHLPSQTTRNAIIFQNFDHTALRDKSVQTQVLFGRKMSRLSRPGHAPSCIITSLPARYRDPQTGLPYANATAYRQIRRMMNDEFQWSRLGVWVDKTTRSARGVPPRFLKPESEDERKARLELQKVKAKEAADAKSKTADTNESSLAGPLVDPAKSVDSAKGVNPAKAVDSAKAVGPAQTMPAESVLIRQTVGAQSTESTGSAPVACLTAP